MLSFLAVVAVLAVRPPTAPAQETGVTAFIAVEQVQTLRLADFDPTNPRAAPFIFTVTVVNDETPRDIDIYVTVTGERSGMLGQIITNRGHVHAGETIILTNRDFDRYELADGASNLIDFASERGVFPPDNYRFHLSVVDPSTGVLYQDEDFVVTSNDITEVYPISPGGPLDQAPERLDVPQPVFLWQSEGRSFVLSLFEVTSPDADASDIANGMPVFTRDGIEGGTFPYPSYAERLRPGITYAWRVESVVRSAEGVERFPSELLWFTVADEGEAGVRTGAPGMTAIHVTPQEYDTTPGGAIQFTAEGFNANDESLGNVSVRWEVVPASAGEITNGGLFTASSVPGVAAIVASTGELSDFATVTITTPAAADPTTGDSLVVAVLSPTDSQVLVEPSPVFRWHVLNADSTTSDRFRVAVSAVDAFGGETPMWTRVVGETTSLAYPSDEPPLEPGSRYVLTVALVDAAGAVLAASDAVEFTLNRDPKISWELYNAWDVAQRTAADSLQSTLLLLVGASGLDPSVRDAIAGAGGTVEVEEGPWVQVSVPFRALATISGIDDVRLLTLPAPHVLSHSMDGSGQDLVEALKSGRPTAPDFGDIELAPVDVVVFEFGFDTLAIAELVGPDRVRYHSFRQDGRIEGSGGADAIHGAATLKAMLGHLPPTATIHLINFDTEPEFQRALRYAVDVIGARVLTCSVSWANAYDDYDGSSHFSKAVTDILGDAAALVVAAGNFARSHWEASFVDTDANHAHDFVDDGASYLTMRLNSRAAYNFLLSWDEWDRPAADLDLEILDDRGTTLYDRYGRPIASRNVQRDDQYVEPLERIRSFRPPYAGVHSYRLRVTTTTPEFARERTPLFELYVYPPPEGTTPLPVETSSLASGLATTRSDRVIPVGAVDFLHSSRGPTNDGRVRPDFSADGGLEYQSRYFEGTSFATPRVAAALGSVLALYPEWTMDRALAYLQGHVAASEPSKDNIVGWGPLDLDILISDLRALGAARTQP